MRLKLFLVTTVLVTAVLFFGIATNTYAAGSCMTYTNVSDQISCLQQLIAQLTAQIAQIQAQQTGQSCHTFIRNLKIGDNNSEVIALEETLRKDGIFPATLEDYSQFDERLASYVVQFQEKYASDILTPNYLTHGTGYVGVSTRIKLNALYGCTSSVSNYYPAVVTPTITNIFPSGAGSDLPAGLPIVITWNSTGLLSSDAIRLSMIDYEGGNPAHLYSLTSEYLTGNMQSYSYTIPSNIIPSPKMKIMVEALRNGLLIVMGVSSNYFTVSVPQPSINVASPAGGETWAPGETHDIVWNSNWLLASDKIDVWLWSYTNSSSAPFATDVIVSSLAGNTSLYHWTVPKNLNSNGARYKIDIEVHRTNGSSLVYDSSDNYFYIVSSPTFSGINVTSGSLSTNFTPSSIVSITWGTPANTPAAQNPIVDLLDQNGNFVMNLGQTSQGSFSWAIPANFTPGTYKIRITTDGVGGIQDGFSNNFNIIPQY